MSNPEPDKWALRELADTFGEKVYTFPAFWIVSILSAALYEGHFLFWSVPFYGACLVFIYLALFDTPFRAWWVKDLPLPPPNPGLADRSYVQRLEDEEEWMLLHLLERDPLTLWSGLTPNLTAWGETLVGYGWATYARKIPNYGTAISALVVEHSWERELTLTPVGREVARWILADQPPLQLGSKDVGGI
jgi:hypothetical protein